MEPQEIASREFPVAMRGYVKEEVQAFLTGVATLVAERDVRLGALEGEVARLESQLADCRQRLASPSAQLDRATLIQQVGTEAATILACADASAERLRAQANGAAERVRIDLERIGTSLADVHGFVGELVAMVADLNQSAASVRVAAPREIHLTDPLPGTIGGGASVEIRTVLGEVLGLDDGSRHGAIHWPSSGVG